jgi:hypothetical protein
MNIYEIQHKTGKNLVGIYRRLDPIVMCVLRKLKHVDDERYDFYNVFGIYCGDEYDVLYEERDGIRYLYIGGWMINHSSDGSSDDFNDTPVEITLNYSDDRGILLHIESELANTGYVQNDVMEDALANLSSTELEERILGKNTVLENPEHKRL